MVEATMWLLWAWIAGIGTLWLLVGTFHHFGVLEKESPDWIVAAGTVAGLFASVFIASSHSREQARLNRNKELVLIASIQHRGKEALAALHALDSALVTYYRPIGEGSPPEILAKVDQLDRQIAQLKSVELAQLPDPQAVDQLTSLIGALDAARAEAVAGRILDKELKENGPIYPLAGYTELCGAYLVELRR